MIINDAMRTYRLPNPTTPEDLECRWSKVLTFGDKILLAGHYYNGKGKPCYFGATYEFLSDDTSCEGTIGLRAASEVEFEDAGFRDLFGPGQLTVCEWSEKAHPYLPDADLELTLTIRGLSRDVTARAASALARTVIEETL